MKQASKTVALILASFPQSKVSNSSIYVSQLTTLIDEYPVEVQKALAHPSRGVPSMTKFLPSVAEVKEKADELLIEYRASIAPPKILPKPEPEIEITKAEAARRIKIAARLKRQFASSML